MSGVVKCGGKAFLAAVVATLMVMACPVSAATFTPTDVAALIAAINAANANGQSDTIDLGGRTFTLTAVDNTLDGPNGLPAILPDGGSTLTIRNGTIEREPGPSPASGHSFASLTSSTGASLALESADASTEWPLQSWRRGLQRRNSLGLPTARFSDNVGASAGRRRSTTSEASRSSTARSRTSGTSGAGGAIYNFGTLSIVGSTLSENYAGIQRGGDL